MHIQANTVSQNLLTYCSSYAVRFEDTEVYNPTTRRAEPGHPHYGISTLFNPHANCLSIPSFQRGIEWEFSTLLQCIEAASPVVGTAVVGQLQGQPQLFHLLDGLQRFASFCYLLHKLSPLLFDRPTPQQPNPWGLHPQLASSTELADIQLYCSAYTGQRTAFEYNFKALLSHRRKVIAGSYAAWVQKAEEKLSVLLEQSNPEFELARSQRFLGSMKELLKKPLYVQNLFNFRDFSELIATFIGINTVRCELSAADVCRSALVDGADKSRGGTPDLTAELENTFNTSLLQADGKVKQGLSPLINVLYADWYEERTWKLVPSLARSTANVQDVLKEFQTISDWIDFMDQQRRSDSYVDLLWNLGHNPYVASLLFYHRTIGDLSQNQPQRLPQAEIHQIAVAYFRRFLDGGVGDTLPLTKRVATDAQMTIQRFLDDATPSRSGRMTTSVPSDWLGITLNDIRDIDSAKKVFHACLLPKVRAGGAFGDPFPPMVFRVGQNNWSIDHLIPKNTFEAPNPFSVGDPYRDTLRNLAPIKGTDNSAYQARSCALKLGDTISYLTYTQDPAKMPNGQGPHPFLAVLVQKQGGSGATSELDTRDWLIQVATSGRNYGQERIEMLRDILLERL